jgi:hypothetical protein
MLPEPSEDTAEIGRKILGDTTVSEGKFKNDLKPIGDHGSTKYSVSSVPGNN